MSFGVRGNVEWLGSGASYAKEFASRYVTRRCCGLPLEMRDHAT